MYDIGNTFIYFFFLFFGLMKFATLRHHWVGDRSLTFSLFHLKSTDGRRVEEELRFQKMICAVLKTANSQFSSPLDGFIQLRPGTQE